VKQSVGVGVRLRTGLGPYASRTVLRLGFFDCGLNGRKIGLVTSDVTEEDIIEQTEKGRQYSASVDWFSTNSYRLVYLPGVGIRVYLGNLKSRPAIDIPWASYSPKATAEVVQEVAFGHFDGRYAGISEWEYFRCHESNGLDFELAQLFSKGVPSEVFGGKSLLLIEATVDDLPPAVPSSPAVVEDLALTEDTVESSIE
jgi:hypothetical protein